MKSVFLRLLKVSLITIVTALILSTSVSAQYFPLPGAFLYALNHPKAQVFDVSPDGKIGIALRNDPNLIQPAYLTTFDPILGTQFDNKSFGFGPLAVRIAQVGNTLRAVVLTSEGGPRRIYLFDVSNTGQLTQITSTQLTTSGADGGSNLVLSSNSAVGFVTVYASTDAEIISFSLNDGAIIKHTTVPSSPPEILALNEGPNRRLLAFRQGNTVKVLNVLDPSQPVEVSSTTVTRNNEFSAINDDSFAFSADGRYLFFANQFYNFAAIDTSTSQVIATIPGADFRFLRVESFEDSQHRLLAVLSSPTGTGGTSALLLVDATNPSQLQILKQVSPAGAVRFKFSHDGSRLYVADNQRIGALNVPDLTTAWTNPVQGTSPTLHQFDVYGPNDEILAAWTIFDGNASAQFGAFPAFPPNVTLSDSITVNEAVGNANFTVTLSAPTTHRTEIKYLTINGTAAVGEDYTSTQGTLVLQPGSTSGMISVPIIDDNIDEDDETLSLKITANPGIVTHDQSTITITDNDPPPSASINDVTAFEGNFGNSLAFFQVTLSAPSSRTITLDYATAAGTATALDFIPISGTLTFPPGQTSNNLVVQILPDRLSESDETFAINLSNATNATINDSQGIGTIVDNDAPILYFDASSQRAIALDTMTLVREPFASINPDYLGTDKQTRISIFSLNLILEPGLVVTAQAIDNQQVVYQLPVEFVGNVPGFNALFPQEPFLTQIVLKLPEGIVNAGDLQVSITTRGKTSNKVLVAVKP
jgi:hypothetical protein